MREFGLRGPCHVSNDAYATDKLWLVLIVSMIATLLFVGVVTRSRLVKFAENYECSRAQSRGPSVSRIIQV